MCPLATVPCHAYAILQAMLQRALCVPWQLCHVMHVILQAMLQRAL